MKRQLGVPKPRVVRLGVVTPDAAFVVERTRKGWRDGREQILHQEILGQDAQDRREAVRDRGINTCAAWMQRQERFAKRAQVAFLLEPTPIDDMARVAVEVGVIPQKSTDFIPSC